MSLGQLPTKPNLLPFQQENVATNQQAIPLPYLAGIRLIGLRWMTSALDEVTQQAGSGKKGGGGSSKKSGGAQNLNYYGTLAGAICWGPLDWLTAIIHNGNYLWQGNLTLSTDLTDLTGSLADQTLIGSGGFLRLYRGTETQPTDGNLPNAPAYLGTAYICAKRIFFGENSGTAPNLQFIGGRLPRISTTIVAAADNIADADRQINPIAALAEIISDERGGGIDISEFDAPSWLAAAHWCAQDADHIATTFCSPLITSQSQMRDIAKELLDPMNGFVRWNAQGLLSCNIYEWGINPGGLQTLDARYWTKRPQFPFGDWVDVPTEILVNFTDKAYEYQNNTTIVPNPRAQQIRQVDDQGTLDRKHICRIAQANRQGVEYLRRIGTAPTKATVYVRRPFATALLVGSKILVNVEPTPTSTGEAQLARVEKITQNQSDEVEMEVMTDAMLAAIPYTPNYAVGAPVVGSSPPLLHFLGIPLPANVWSWPPAVCLLATRSAGNQAGFEAFFGTSDSLPFDDLGSAPGFAVRCTLEAACGVGDVTLAITLTDGTSGLDAMLALNTPSGNTTEANDDTLLAVITVLDSNGRVPLKSNGDPAMEFVSIVQQASGSGLPANTFNYTVIRGRQGLPAQAWAAGATVWIVPKQNIVPWRHAGLTTLLGGLALFRLVSFTANAEDETIPVPECGVNIPPITAPSFAGVDTGGGPGNQGLQSPVVVQGKIAVGSLGYNPAFGPTNTFPLLGTLMGSISAPTSGLSNTIFPLVQFNGWATGAPGEDPTRYGNANPTFICQASGDYAITAGDAYSTIVYSLDGGTTWNNVTTWQEISTSSVHSFSVGSNVSLSGLSPTGSVKFGIRCNADFASTQVLVGELTVTAVNI